MIVFVECYIRLLDIMIEALTRLDSDSELKQDLKTEMICYKTLTPTSKLHTICY